MYVCYDFIFNAVIAKRISLCRCMEIIVVAPLHVTFLYTYVYVYTCTHTYV